MSDNDSVYYDMHMEGDAPPEKSKASRIIHLIAVTAGSVLIAAILFILIYRMIEMREPSGVGELIFTDGTYDAYARAGAPAVKEPYGDPNLYAYEKETLREVTLTKKGKTKEDYEKVVLPVGEYYADRGRSGYEANTGSYTAEINGVKTTVKVSGYYEEKGSPVEGAMRVDHVYFLPFARQIQLTFRYKSDALSKLGGKPDGFGEEFTFRIFDDAGRVYKDYSFKTERRGVYRYITMVFEDVEFDAAGKFSLAVRWLDEEDRRQELDLPFYDEELPLPLLNCEVSEKVPETLRVYTGREDD